VIPVALRDEVLKSLHSAHQGVTKTLQKASMSVFWPGLKRRVEEKCLHCESCVKAERTQSKEPLIPFAVPETPFQCVGVDLFCLDGVDYLLLVDYLTKWPVVKTLSRVGTTSKAVIQCIREIFADFGLADTIVSDNGPQFSSVQFKEFCKQLNIEHKTSSPLHPSGNGQSERTIGTIKSMMKKCNSEGSDWLTGLLTIRNTPIAQGLPSPAELLQGRILRDSHPVCIDKYKVKGYNLEEIREKLGNVKSADKYYHDNHAKDEKQFLIANQPVYFRTASGEWRHGKIIKLVGERSYAIDAGQCVIRRNRKDIKPCKIVPEIPYQPIIEKKQPTGNPISDKPYDSIPAASVCPEPAPTVVPVPLDLPPRPIRLKKRPIWHKDYVMT
jgi:hypothetical protein